MLLSILGYGMIIAMMYLLLKGKASPIVVFLTLPLAVGVILAIIGTFAPDTVPFMLTMKKNIVLTLADFVKTGVGKTTSNAVLFCFSVPFFGIMNKLGVFDGIVNFLTEKSDKNVVLVLLATAIIATVAHLDGSAASTVLITIPAMLPIYKRMKIDPRILLMIVAGSVGIMNLVPWGGPTARVAVVSGIDGNIIWRTLIPVQIATFAALAAVAVFVGIKQKRYIASVGAENINYDHYGPAAGETISTGSNASNVSRTKNYINIGITAAVIGMLIWGKFPTYLPFMIGMGIALLINFKDLKQQEKMIKEQGSATMLIVVTMLASGVFVGIFEGTGMLNEMAKLLIYIIPSFLAKYLHIIMGFLGLPIGLVLGTDTYFYGLYPLMAEVGNQYGISTLQMGLGMLVSKNLAVLISPLVPPTFLALALSGVELKDHIRYSFPWMAAMTAVGIVTAVVTGIIPLT